MSPIFIRRYRAGGGIKLDYPDAYGMVIDNNIDDPTQMITYIGKNAGYRPVSVTWDKGYFQGFDHGDWKDAFFMPRFCYVAPNGEVLRYAKRDDVTKQENGSDSGFLTAGADFLGVKGNFMMEFPKIYYKVYHDLKEDKGYIFFADRKLDKDFVCYANVDANNNEIDRFYMSMFETYLDTSVSNYYRWRSKAKASVKLYPTIHGQAIARDHTWAMNNNVGEDKIWFPGLYCDRVIIDYLLLLVTRNTDLQGVFGNGYGVTTAAGVNNKVYKNAADSYNLNDTSYGKKSLGLFGFYNGCVRVFGLENYWGNASERIWGCFGLSSGNGNRVKMTYGTYDGSSVVGFENSYNGKAGEGFIDTGILNKVVLPEGVSSGESISRMYYTPYGMFAKEKKGSGNDNIGFCDRWYGGAGPYMKPSGLITQAVQAWQRGPMCRFYSAEEMISSRLSCKPLAS